jgi:hypothetical protein
MRRDGRLDSFDKPTDRSAIEEFSLLVETKAANWN